METKFDQLDTTTVNNIRCLGFELVANANSGHQGLPSGMAPSAHVLFSRHLNLGGDPKWINRDRFILSAGHGSALLYTMLHLSGFLEMDDLKKFRTLHSKTPGHPESRLTPGVEFTSGPLGQGISSAVGVSIATEFLKKSFNSNEFPVISHDVFVLCGDGCLQEGVAAEASSLAGHLKLGSLIVLYDDNHTTIDGHTEIAFTENVYERFNSYGWHTIVVEKGDDDLQGINDAIETARKMDKPTLIGVKTKIGFGSAKEGTNQIHGFGTKLDEVLKIRQKFGLKQEHFDIHPDSLKLYEKGREAHKKREARWGEMMKKYEEKEPEKFALFQQFLKKDLGDNLEKLDKLLTVEKHPGETPMATRKYSGLVLNSIVEKYPFVIGGSADLEGSNCTKLISSGPFQPNNYLGKTIQFGVREHAMAAICNGLAEYQYGAGFIPFCATFFVFIGYLGGAQRVCSLAELPVIYIMTHDSVFVGEDGPTHQPVEQLAQLRAYSNFYVTRPASFEETRAAYALALMSKKTPTAICLSRQNVLPVPGSDFFKAAKFGGYTVVENEKCDVVLVATGSEVGLCCQIAKKVNAKVVSLMCCEKFSEQSEEYRKKVLGGSKKPIVSVEAGVTFGWERFSHVQIGINGFGESANEKILKKHFGFVEDKLVEKVEKVKEFYKEKPVFDLFSKFEF